MSRTSVTVHLPDELLATIKSLAAEEERSRNQVICRLLNDALTLPRVVNDRGELRAFGAPSSAITVNDLSIPAPTGDVTKATVPEVPALDAIPGVVRASSLSRPVTTEPREFRGPIPKGGKK